MRTFRNPLRGLRGDERGLAAVEFALILPVLIAMFFGMLEISDAMMANRRVQTAVNSLADLISQERDITTGEIDDIMVGVTRMLAPTTGSTVTMRVTSVTVDPDDDDKLIVRWSRDNAGGTPYAADADFTRLPDNTVVNSGASVIVGEITYNHASALTHMFVSTPRSMNQVVSRWPRRTNEVVICGASPLPTCVD